MRRFVYTPTVQAYIKTDFGILDVSNDIISGSVTRRVNAASGARLELQNPHRKYIRKIRPMDQIAIYLSRVKPMLVFSGYVDSAPLDQLYPGPVSISASCTLKRLLYTFWDPSLSYVQQFFQKHGWDWDVMTGNIYDQNSDLWNLDINNGIGEMMRIVLNEVGGWPIGRVGETNNTVHVLSLPPEFLAKTESMIANQRQETETQRKNISDILKQLLTVEGSFTDPFTNTGANATYSFSSSYGDTLPLPKSLAGSYKARIYGRPIKYDVSGVPAQLTGTARNNRIAYGGAALAAANKYGVPYHIFFGLIRRESAWGSIDGGRVDEDNFAGAIGLTQVVPPKYGYDKSDIIGDAGLQLDIGAHYLSDMYKMFKDWRLALAAYNAGPGNVQKYDGIPPFAETRIYVPTVMDYAEQEKQAQKGVRASDTTPGGSVGMVKVGSRKFFKQIKEDENAIGHTFRIRGNPYGDDNMIFKAISRDPSLGEREIAIYVPGGTQQALAWTDRTVSIETSYGRTRFQKPDSAAKTPSAIDPKKMTTQQLTGGSGVSTAGLRSITLAGLAFIQSNFGPFRLNQGMWQPGSPSAKNGDHPKGLALDLEPINSAGRIDWGPEGVARTDALARWAGWKPNNGGNTTGNATTRWVGWRTESNHGPGNHIHVSFLGDVSVDDMPAATAGGQRGGKVNFAPGVEQSDYGATGVPATLDEVTEIAASIGTGLPLIFPLASDALLAESLTGNLALSNDVPLMEFVEFMSKASGRHFMSMPNGDFVAFYPDYFNWANQLPLLTVSDIETMDLNISISDDRLATHVFTTADTFTPNGEIDFTDRIATMVASVETIGSFNKLVSVGSDFDSSEFLTRYGARPKTVEVPEIKNAFLQFMYGWTTFLENWAEMFQAEPTFTFMPELFPGSLIEFASRDLVMYVNEVTHTFDMEGGFTTTAQLMAPSTLSRDSNVGMVLAGGYQ